MAFQKVPHDLLNGLLIRSFLSYSSYDVFKNVFLEKINKIFRQEENMWSKYQWRTATRSAQQTRCALLVCADFLWFVMVHYACFSHTVVFPTGTHDEAPLCEIDQEKHFENELLTLWRTVSPNSFAIFSFHREATYLFLLAGGVFQACPEKMPRNLGHGAPSRNTANNVEHTPPALTPPALESGVTHGRLNFGAQE